MAEKLKTTRGSGNVFRDLDFPPDQAHDLMLRADLMIAIQRHLRRSGLSQTEAARKLGIAQPRLSDLFRHRIERFSLDALVNLAAKAGLSAPIRAKVRPDTRPTDEAERLPKHSTIPRQ